MPEQKDTLTITLKLGLRQTQMVVRREDEFIYREAEKLFNERFNFYASRYPGQGGETYLTMALLDLAVQNKRKEVELDHAPMVSALESLLADVEAALPQ